MKLSSQDSEVLEKYEKNICSELQKVGKVIAVFPMEKKNSQYFRLIFFFIEENFAHFMNNLILPKKIEIYFSQESAVFTWDIAKNIVAFRLGK